MRVPWRARRMLSLRNTVALVVASRSNEKKNDRLEAVMCQLVVARRKWESAYTVSPALSAGLFIHSFTHKLSLIVDYVNTTNPIKPQPSDKRRVKPRPSSYKSTHP